MSFLALIINFFIIPMENFLKLMKVIKEMIIIPQTIITTTKTISAFFSIQLNISLPNSLLQPKTTCIKTFIRPNLPVYILEQAII